MLLLAHDLTQSEVTSLQLRTYGTATTSAGAVTIPLQCSGHNTDTLEALLPNARYLRSCYRAVPQSETMSRRCRLHGGLLGRLRDPTKSTSDIMVEQTTQWALFECCVVPIVMLIMIALAALFFHAHH